MCGNIQLAKNAPEFLGLMGRAGGGRANNFQT